MGVEDSSSSRTEEASALQQDCDHNEDTANTVVVYCGWFHGLCSTWRGQSRGNDDMCHEEELKKEHLHHENWLVKELKERWKGLKKNVEGWRKWKTSFMRRVRRSWSCSSSRSGAKNNKRMKFQYDPKSYALNFDDGIEKELGDDGVYLDFTARYACPLRMMGINNKKKEYLGL